MFTPQIEKTPEIKKKQITLLIIFTIGIILLLCKINYLSIALNELFQNLLLLCGTLCLNYCLIVFYIILVFFNSLMIFQIIGIEIQKSIILGNISLDKSQIFGFSIFILTLIFNIVSVVICFFTYKKFKSESFKKKGNNNYLPLNDLNNIKDKLNITGKNEENNKENEKNGFVAFKGEGLKIG